MAKINKSNVAKYREIYAQIVKKLPDKINEKRLLEYALWRIDGMEDKIDPIEEVWLDQILHFENKHLLNAIHLFKTYSHSDYYGTKITGVTMDVVFVKCLEQIGIYEATTGSGFHLYNQIINGTYRGTRMWNNFLDIVEGNHRINKGM